AREKAAHLLNRTTFGPTPHDIDELSRKGETGIQSWIETQLNPSTIKDIEVERKLKKLPSIWMTNQELYLNYPRSGKVKKVKDGSSSKDENPRQILVELATQKLVRAVESERQLQEVLVDFWFNHFNVDFNKNQDKWLITSYEREAIRPNVFGKFSTMLKAVAKNPAMLVYLDNASSVRSVTIAKDKTSKTKKKPPASKKNRGLNENYARELMELHTLGVEGGYSQKDVIDVARLLTGWSVDRKDDALTFLYKDNMHDKGAKKVLGVTYPAGGGEEEGVKLLEFLAKQPATAKFISTKLAKRFISDNPSPETIEKLSKVFLETDGNLSSVYREIFKSPEFWSSKNFASKIKKPFHLIASVSRGLNAKISLDDKGLKKIDTALAQLGEPIYRCQPPTGFKDAAENWVNAGALVLRIQSALTIADQRIPAIQYDKSSFVNKLRNANVIGSNKDSLKYLDSILMASSLREETINKISDELGAEPQVQDEADFKKSKKVKSKKSEDDKATVNTTRLLGLLLGSPEFQRY
ncbi:MAG: DUF1800 domain-containing protein, partial [Proteobacteria bacterium]|nr:DUF1800 domain-containing protein [Pseudomonadota bacterium]